VAIILDAEVSVDRSRDCWYRRSILPPEISQDVCLLISGWLKGRSADDDTGRTPAGGTNEAIRKGA